MITISYENSDLNYLIEYTFNPSFFDAEWLEDKLAVLADITQAFIAEYDKKLKGEE